MLLRKQCSGVGAMILLQSSLDPVLAVAVLLTTGWCYAHVTSFLSARRW
jgi:hypothetical protein